MKYAEIYKFDISNGPGIRVSLFVQGCDKRCPGCFNSESWDFNAGREFNEEALSELFRLTENDWISGLSILGGEPFAANNAGEVIVICQQFKQKFPNKNIWIWTGNSMDDNAWYLRSAYKDGESYLTFKQMVDKYVDVIIDGPFVEAKKDLSLPWRGSYNQRIWMKDEYGKWYDASNNFE